MNREVIVKRLLQCDRVDLNLKDNKGRTPLFWAVKEGKGSMAKLLLKSSRVDLNFSDGRLLLWEAMESWDKTVVRLPIEYNAAVLDSTNTRGYTPLLWAISEGEEEMVKVILNSGRVDLKRINNGRLPLWIAIKNGHTEIVKLLIESDKGVLDSKNNLGWTALHWAAFIGREKVVDRLLSYSYSSPLDNNDRTPLWWARHNGHVSVVKLLEKYEKHWPYR